MTSVAPLKVAVLVHTAVPSGAELALTRLLGAIDRYRFDVTVVLFAPGPLAELLRTSGIDVRVVPLPSQVGQTQRHRLLHPRSLLVLPRLLRFVVSLVKVLRRMDVNIVHANSLKSGLIATVACRLARLPLAWYVHDRISSDYLPAPVATAVRLAVRHGATAVLANSMATLRTLQLPERSPGVVAYPGLPTSAFAVSLAPADPPLVGMIGRISPTKGQDVFLRAAAQVRATHPNVRFVVVGSALFAEQEYEQDVRSLATALGLGEAVRFAGQLADPTSVLATLAVLVHASPVPEPFGQVISEAMAAGVPVIATRGGGVDEVVGADNQCALTIAPNNPPLLANAIRQVLDDPASAAARSRCARTRARDLFGIDQTAETVTETWCRAAAR